jgi:hypothetical protein
LTFSFTGSATNFTNSCKGFGQRIPKAQNLLVYGVGFYSFYDDYSMTYSNQRNGQAFQEDNFEINSSFVRNIAGQRM